MNVFQKYENLKVRMDRNGLVEEYEKNDKKISSILKQILKIVIALIPTFVTLLVINFFLPPWMPLAVLGIIIFIVVVGLFVVILIFRLIPLFVLYFAQMVISDYLDDLNREIVLCSMN